MNPQDITFGIEVEAIFPNGDPSYSNDWEMVGDGSLGNCGRELRLRRPKTLADLDSIADDIKTILTNGDAQWSDNSQRYYNSDEFRSRQYSYACGLHIHLGVPKTATIGNVAQLIKRCVAEESRIQRMGNRRVGEWCGSTSRLLDAMKNGESIRGSTRYYGINTTNMGHSRKNTIEFRYASSSIAFDPDKLKAYVMCIYDIWKDTMYSEPSKIINLDGKALLQCLGRFNDKSRYKVMNGHDIKDFVQDM